jgi:uncharacterized protein
MIRPVRSPVPLFLPLLLPLVLGGAPVPAQAQDSVLEVQGRGEVEVSPDRARIVFAVESEAPTARDAGEANARLMDGVISSVRGLGVEGLRVETSGYTLVPRYGQDADRRREIVGYTARNTLQVVADDVDAVGRLVDTALDAGANRVAGLGFEVRDPEPHRREALRRAVESARSEAQAMAEALGLRLGTPTRVQGGAERPPIPFFPQVARMEAMAMDAPTTPVEAGIQTVSASVSITYRLHPD